MTILKITKLLFSFTLIILFSCTKKNPTYDLVIFNGRVIDPETGLDAIRNIGVTGKQISIISVDSLTGIKYIDATGFVVAPGFIDLHAHGQTNVENSYQAYDGVTTALELEIGVDTLAAFLKARKGKALLNFGASACQLAIRNKIISGTSTPHKNIYNELNIPAIKEAVNPIKFDAVRALLKVSLAQGAIGIGVPVGYQSGATISEIFDVYAFAAEENTPIFSHIREGGAIAFQQALANALINNSTLHICHLNSMARKDVRICLEMVEQAKKNGFKISTEIYPYTAGNTEISSAIFDAGWQERLGCTYEDLQWVETGERLTQENFENYRKTGGSVIIHMMKPKWIEQCLQSSATAIASDGGEYSPFGHPRGAGTFARVLGKYVRELKVLTLNEALYKMTYLPAKTLEPFVPSMKKRGRIQEDCFADIVIFKAEKIIDKATFKRGFQKSEGVKHLLINGQILIKNAKLLPEVFPGEAITSK